MQFTFVDTDDVTSVQAQITDEEGYTYSSKVEVKEITGEEVLNLRNVDSPVMIVPENGDIELNDEIGSNVTLKRGEVGFVMASTSQVVIKAEKEKALRLALDK